MFFDRLQMRCAEVGIKVTPLVRELGISSGAVGRWKSGTLPNGETLLKLASRLDCTVDYLLGRDEKKPTPEDGDGLDEGALEQEFMRWFRMQPLDRQKEILFDLVQAVPGPGQGE